jgi:hypothetical protein
MVMRFSTLHNVKAALRTVRGVTFACIAACLCFAFAVSVCEAQPIDRSTRQTQQRSRANRNPRYRISPGVSLDCCQLQYTLSSRHSACGSLREPIQNCNLQQLDFVEFLTSAPQPKPNSSPKPFSTFSRPPPSFS